jgi:putative transposase
MSEYRRAYLPGGTFFLTLVTYHRTPLFSDPENISRLRSCVAKTRTERPFEITGAVVLPDHIHFLWTLPPDDSDYSQRVSRMKILFTRSLRGRRSLPQNVSAPVANIEKVMCGSVGFGNIRLEMKLTWKSI